jgi:hypothetical protein
MLLPYSEVNLNKLGLYLRFLINAFSSNTSKCLSQQLIVTFIEGAERFWMDILRVVTRIKVAGTIFINATPNPKNV